MTESSSATTAAVSGGITTKDHPLEGLTIEATLPAVSSLQEISSATSSESASENDDCDDDFENYNIDLAAVAWDQISELTHEITSSLMAKQASILCKRFRQQEALLNTSAAAPSKKRRVLSDLPSSSSKKPVVDAALVTSDEESHSEQQQHQQDQGLPDELSVAVSRIGRMSKLVLEIEYCQKELRKEMLAMGDQLE